MLHAYVCASMCNVAPARGICFGCTVLNLCAQAVQRILATSLSAGALEHCNRGAQGKKFFKIFDKNPFSFQLRLTSAVLGFFKLAPSVRPLQALFEQPRLPEDPFEFIFDHVDSQRAEEEADEPKTSHEQEHQASTAPLPIPPIQHNTLMSSPSFHRAQQQTQASINSQRQQQLPRCAILEVIWLFSRQVPCLPAAHLYVIGDELQTEKSRTLNRGEAMKVRT